MPTITITNAAMDAIRAQGGAHFKQTGVRTGPDEWRVPIDQDTIEQIRGEALKGESLSDTILRIATIGLGKTQ